MNKLPEWDDIVIDSCSKPYYTPAMWDLIRQHAPDAKVVVEIGSQWGEWAYHFLSQFNPVHYFAIDPWKPVILKTWIKRMDRWVWRIAFPICHRSSVWAPFFFEEIDILYIDGDHRAKAISADLELWVPKIRHGGLLLGHDYGEKAVQTVTDAFFFERWGKKPETIMGGPNKRVPTFWKVIP